MEARTLRFPLWAKIATVALVATVFLVLLRTMGGLLTPFLWALVTAYLFNPLVRWLSQRSRVQRFWVARRNSCERAFLARQTNNLAARGSTWTW